VTAMHDRLVSGAVTGIHRCDTRDMLCDSLTKGTISRKAVLDAFAQGKWTIAVWDQLHPHSIVKKYNSAKP